MRQSVASDVVRVDRGRKLLESSRRNQNIDILEQANSREEAVHAPVLIGFGSKIKPTACVMSGGGVRLALRESG